MMGKLAIEDLKPGMIVHATPWLVDGTGDAALEDRPTAVVILKYGGVLLGLDVEDKRTALDKESGQFFTHPFRIKRNEDDPELILHSTRGEALRAAVNAERESLQKDMKLLEAWSELTESEE